MKIKTMSLMAIMLFSLISHAEQFMCNGINSQEPTYIDLDNNVMKNIGSVYGHEVSLMRAGAYIHMELLNLQTNDVTVVLSRTDSISFTKLSGNKINLAVSCIKL